MNTTLANKGRELLKELLSQLQENHHVMFTRMYAPYNLRAGINEVVDQMDEEKISGAISQCERTIEGLK